MDESPIDKKKTRCGSCIKWMGTPPCLLLCNFLLSQWGDWMWNFSAGLYLVHLSNGQLRLAAVLGFTGGTFILLFGGLIGDWVDKNGRLKVVRLSLFVQNISVALSATSVCVVFALEPSTMVSGYPARYLMEIAVVVLAVIAQLASVAYKIAIEKDWIIVIASGRSSTLSNLNAVTRSLDLLCKILAPLTVGFIMSTFSMFASACVIAAWNVVSVFIEYALLARIYQQVPQLAKKAIPTQEANGTESTLLKDRSAPRHSGDENKDEDNVAMVTAPQDDSPGGLEKGGSVHKSRLREILKPLSILFKGWKIYARQPVVFAGVSLACLYMTVLGFDSITLGYIYANNISEFMVGICMGLAGVTGILGTFLFTIMAKRWGLERTGVFAYVADLSCLVLALASVWAPGSKFDPVSAFKSSPESTTSHSNINLISTSTLRHLSHSSEFSRNISIPHPRDVLNVSTDYLSSNGSTPDDGLASFPTDNTSMILLLVGIIMSRIGLWMIDLVVTQMMQESIAEEERGVVNGVQNSLNMLMDMLKFILVIFLPQIEIFGLHIIVSFTFISAGAGFFFYHVGRGHALKKPSNKDNNNGNVLPV